MNASLGKRVSAYLIDIVLIVIISIILMGFIPKSEKYLEKAKQLDDLYTEYVDKTITVEEYISNYKEISYEYEKESLIFNVFDIVFVFGYFVIIPVVNNGQTIGKKLLKIKLVKEDESKLTIKDTFIRSVIVTTLAVNVINLILVNTVNYELFFILTIILSAIKTVLIIIAVFMISMRKDKKGLHDIMTKTKVVEEVA